MTTPDELPVVQVERKMAPVQGYTPGIPWSLHLEAYDAYCKKWGRQQALIEGGCRGGFHVGELDDFIPGWRERVSEITALRNEVAALLAERDALRELCEKIAGEATRWRAKAETAEAELARRREAEGALVAKWRTDDADDTHSISLWDQGFAHGKNECADELAAIDTQGGGDECPRD